MPNSICPLCKNWMDFRLTDESQKLTALTLINEKNILKLFVKKL